MERLLDAKTLSIKGIGIFESLAAVSLSILDSFLDISVRPQADGFPRSVSIAAAYLPFVDINATTLYKQPPPKPWSIN